MKFKKYSKTSNVFWPKHKLNILKHLNKLTEWDPITTGYSQIESFKSNRPK